jgi:two-component system cell cycle sensor histidine kinase/response regulator CckA
MEKLLGDEQFSTVSVIATNISTELDDRMRALEKVAARITPTILSNAMTTQKFLEDRIAFPMLFNAGTYVTRLDGVAIADVPISTGRIRVNYSDRVYIMETLKGKTTISSPIVSRKLHAPSFVMSTPIRDAKGEVIGVLAGRINLSQSNFLSKITDNIYGKSGCYLLVSRKIRTIVYATDKKRIMEVLPTIGINPFIDRAIEGWEGSGIAHTPLGEEVLASVKGIPLSDWNVVALMPTKEIFAPIHAMQKRMLLAAIFMTLLAGGLTLWILKRQLEPVFNTIKTLTILSTTDKPLQPLPITRQDEIGELIGGFNHLLEVLEQRRAALKQSEENYRGLFNNASIGIFHSLPEGRFLRVNPMLARMMRYDSPEEMISSITDINTQIYVDSKKRLELLAITLETVGWVYSENRYRRKDGTILTANLSVRKVLNPDSTVSYLEGFVEDITERKRSEEALRESEGKYRTIIEDIEDGYHEVDMRGNFTFFNESVCKMIGYGREELLGMNNRQYADQDNARKVYQAYNRVFLTGQPVKNFEWQIIRKDGARRDVEVSISLIRDGAGHPTGFRGIVRDITERKRAEEEKRSLQDRLQRAEKMEALGQLAGGVAHDLNNVLGVLSGYSELLIEKIPADNPIRKYAENIFKSTQKGAAIIQDLLTLARRGVVVSQVVDINGIVSNLLVTIEFDKLKDYHPGVTFRKGLEKDLLNIKGSPVHLEKTVMNLVSNAAEAIVGAGEVTIWTENRYLDKAVRGYDQVNEGDYVVLSVSDTGRGIPAADLNKIFEPFYTKKKMGRSGTGLGLAIVWGTVKDHEGYIDVQSAEEKGTTFTLYFPVTREKMSDETKKIPVDEYMGHGESVLVVDDVEEQRMVATALLMELGYRVHAVSSGEKAVDYLRESKADILILDMIMDPGIDGLETYQRILEIKPHQKAIIVSGFSETDRVKEAQKLGAGAYVKKPYVTEKIGIAIRDELNRK